MRHTGPHGRPGTTPPVPGRPTPFLKFPQLLAVLAVLSLSFGLLSWQIAAYGPLRAADERLGRLVRHSGFPDGPAELLADLGNVMVAPVVLAAAAGYAAVRARRAGEARWWVAPLGAVLALAAVPLLVAPLKALFARPGPPGMAGSDSAGFYPSGHAATAVVAYGAAALLLLPWLRTTRLRGQLLAATGVLTAAVGFGLVRRGYHWPLDVLASWLLGGMLLVALVLAARRLRRTAVRRQ
ncbi:phosphatase PAP2 family protein [Streptomyces cavernicola]|uniref:Phosphatase PAP2 family protein n=1 Tax=Streptomyces cavernicola TaxID=3043613 RepID=A0ABT6SGC4_9ACTN|nr:phosphatase PAP2 family protein [Streptomyces sp. B-S-A6]MDI3407233.1 phosphatase PAP2 family protein [Streptomyces sp. B-S-A6]